MILHMMFIIVVQQWVFSYDYIMILHMMIAMFIAHKKMFWDMLIITMMTTKSFEHQTSRIAYPNVQTSI